MPRVAAKDRDAFVETRRADILAAALRLWAENGYAATSVEAVAREAGLSKGALYLYFPSKRALLDELVVTHSLLPDMEKLMPQLRQHSVEDVVKLLVKLIWRRLEAERDLIRVVVRELLTHMEDARDLIERVVLPTNRLFAAFLEEKLGLSRSRRLDPLVAGRGLFGMVLVWYVSQEIMGGAELCPVPEDEATTTIAELFLHGVVGPEAAA